MHTNHNSVCLINIDLIIIFDNIFVRWTSLYMLLFSFTCPTISYIVLIFTT